MTDIVRVKLNDRTTQKNNVLIDECEEGYFFDTRHTNSQQICSFVYKDNYVRLHDKSLSDLISDVRASLYNGHEVHAVIEVKDKKINFLRFEFEDITTKSNSIPDPKSYLNISNYGIF